MYMMCLDKVGRDSGDWGGQESECVYACIYFKQRAQMHCVLILEAKRATITQGPHAGGLVLSTLSMTKVTLDFLRATLEYKSSHLTSHS